MASRTTTKIMIIRHAEKPPADDDATPAKRILEGPPYGVDVDGNNSNESLTVRGWHRAGALASFFAPTNGPLPNANLATPQFLFASDSKSRRPLETIAPLGEKLGLSPTVSKKGEYQAIADAAMSCGGAALISWQHQDIPEMANHIVGNTTTVPQKWPGHRFDVVWVFDLDPASRTYSFTQVPQCVLAGDSDQPIPDD